MLEYLGPRMARFEQEYNPYPDALWNKIKQEITEAMDIFIPRRLTKRKNSRPWIDKKLHRLIKTKRRLYKRCKKRGSTHLEKRYNLYKHTVQKLLRKQHAGYVHRLFTDSDKTSAELSILDLRKAQKICCCIDCRPTQEGKPTCDFCKREGGNLK